MAHPFAVGDGGEVGQPTRDLDARAMKFDRRFHRYFADFVTAAEPIGAARHDHCALGFGHVVPFEAPADEFGSFRRHDQCPSHKPGSPRSAYFQAGVLPSLTCIS